MVLPSACHLKFPPDYISEPRFHVYVYGEKVGFGLGGDSHRFRLDGWSHTEPNFTWTDGIGASLIFSAPRTLRDVTLHMRLAPFIHPPELAMQPVRVFVNGRKIADWEVTEEKDYIATIPNRFVAPRSKTAGRPDVRDSVVILIDLLIPKAQFPALIAHQPDWRRLGVLCSELVMREGPLHESPRPGTELQADANDISYTLGDVVLFGSGQNSDRYKVSGWNPAEAGYDWTAKEPAVMKFKVKPPKSALSLTLKANGNVLPPQLAAQATEVYANKHLVAEWQVDVQADYSAEIPSELIEDDGILSLEFVCKNAISPRELGVNSDGRDLGIACYELTLSDADE